MQVKFEFVDFDIELTEEQKHLTQAKIISAYFEILHMSSRVYLFEDDVLDNYLEEQILTIVIHKDVFKYGETWCSGLTHWFTPNMDSKIELAHRVLFQEGQRPAHHEWGHWLALYAEDPDWAAFGHGIASDKMMNNLQADMKSLYMNNYLVVYRDVFVGWKEILGHSKDYQAGFYFEVENGKLICVVMQDEKIVDFTKNEGSEWLWHFIAKNGKLQPRVFDKEI